MSMFVNVVRVTPAAFAQIEKDPMQLEAVFFEPEGGDAAARAKTLAQLGIEDNHSGGFDYISADMMMEAIEEYCGDEDDDEADEEAGDEEEDGVYRDMGADGTLDYDAGYGPAFTLSPAAVKKAAKHSAVIELDDDVKQIFEDAAERGDYIIGVVS